MKIEDLYYPIPETDIDDENFDIKKWRIENPMDYLKAMYIIINTPDKNVVFNKIYEISRLYIPDVLYKFHSLTDNIALNELKLNTLGQKNIFMSDVVYLNDPFDNKSYYYRPDVLKEYERLKRCDGKIIDDSSTLCKVTALTSNNTNSMPMWAHYANNHKGFCVSYDMKSNIKLSGCTFPIQYTNQRIDITSFMVQQVEYFIKEIEIQSTKGQKQILFNDLSLIYMHLYLCNIKHISWSYENEFRCSIGANNKEMSYISAVPKEIFIGMNCFPSYIDKIVKIAKTMNVPVYKMEFDEFSTDFNINPIRI